MGPVPGPPNNGDISQQSISPIRTIDSLYRTSPGSAGLDLGSSTTVILTPDSQTVKIPTGIFGPLPKGTVGFILGRSSTSMQGIKVLPGVIDSDYTKELQIMI